MKFIKKHISIFVAILVLILVVLGLLIVKDVFFPNENQAIYGNRLEGIEKYPITDETKNKIKESMQEGTTNISIRLAGRILYIQVNVNAETSVEASKALANKALEVLSEEEKKYYDIQFLINNEANTAQFPIIGYKHHNKTAISWTKDRTES